MSRSLLGLLLCVSLAGCPGSIDQPVSPPIKPPDTNLCAKMCDHLMELGCEEAKPVYNSDKPGPVDVPNQTCTDFCEELQNNGVSVNPRCVLKAPACEQIETYRQKDPASCMAP